MDAAARALAEPTRRDILRLVRDEERSVNDIAIGFSGAPGHQTQDPIGAYLKTETTIETAPLPDDFANLEVLTSAPEEMEPGLTLLDLGTLGPGQRYITAVDTQGEVVWYYAYAQGFSSTTRLDDGLFMVMSPGQNTLTEMDVLGNVQIEFHMTGNTEGNPGSIPIDASFIHHDAIKLPNGNYVTSIRDTSRSVEDYPLDETDPSQIGTVPVIDEPVIEFTPEGVIQGRWNFLDFLKPTRIAYGATRGLPDDPADWVHLNAIWHDPGDDSFIVSLRQQDAVVKFSRQNGELKWILGTPANWEGFEEYLLTPLGSDLTWQYHQHAPMLTPDGTLLLYDNGNEKASPFTGEPRVDPAANFSRAVEFEIDEQAMTVSQVWEYGLEQSGEQLYTPFIGDADDLPLTRNVLITFGGVCTEDGIPSGAIRDCRLNARIIEVTHDSEPVKVFDLLVNDEDPTARGYAVYRADRIPSLYPDPGVEIIPLD